MRDTSDSKAHSTKSSANLSAAQAATSGNHPVYASKQPIGGKKGAKESSNQRRKKSNTSSNSQGKNDVSNGSRRGSSRDSTDDLARKTFLVKEFIEQLIDKACEIADAEE